MKANPVGWFKIYGQDMPRANTYLRSHVPTRAGDDCGSEMGMWMLPMDEQACGAPDALNWREGLPHQRVPIPDTDCNRHTSGYR